MRALKGQSGGTIITDGSSQLVHTLLQHDLIDELHLLVHPVILGGAKRLWTQSTNSFTLKSARSYPTGVVGLHYTRQA